MSGHSFDTEVVEDDTGVIVFLVEAKPRPTQEHTGRDDVPQARAEGPGVLVEPDPHEVALDLDSEFVGGTGGENNTDLHLVLNIPGSPQYLSDFNFMVIRLCRVEDKPGVQVVVGIDVTEDQARVD